MIKRNNKKGFTIVELVIVIAVIAILAAVLIPTFAGIIKKANISADTQLCKNMNTALSMAKAEGKSVDTMEDVLFAINEAGYVIENLNPTTEGYYFAWDKKNGQILFLNEELGLHYPEDATLNPADCWITVLEADEITKVATAGFSLYLEPGFSGNLTLNKLVSVDAGVNTVANLTITDTATAGTIELRGSYTAATLNVPNADVEQHGAITNLTVTAVKDGTLKINGYVKTLAVAAGKVVVNNTGVIETITEGAEKIDGAASTGLILDATDVTGYTAPTSVTINNKAELIAFRDAVNSGYTYNNNDTPVTVTLTADIDLAGVAWLPIGNVYRDNAGTNGAIAGFAGIFDGGNHTIKNLSNNGFSVDGLASGRNSSSVGDKNEIVFGLFGCVNGATIKNLTVNANIDDTGAQYTGDAVAAIVGYAYGDGLVLENCKATGSVTSYDNVGGLVGYCKANAGSAVTITNCTNEATVTGTRKTGGIIGQLTRAKCDPEAAKVEATFSGCKATGKATCLGREMDKDATPNTSSNYYKCGQVAVVQPSVNCTVNGTAVVHNTDGSFAQVN